LKAPNEGKGAVIYIAKEGKGAVIYIYIYIFGGLLPPLKAKER